MFDKFLKLFDIRSDNQWLNIVFGGVISLIIAWSAVSLVFDSNETIWTIILFIVLWGFLIVGEYSTSKAKQEGVQKNKSKKKKKK